MSDIDSAEKRMLAIEKRLLSMEAKQESPSAGVASSELVASALREYQIQMLSKLTVIRDKINEDGGDVTAIKKERDAAVAENNLLKKEIEKLNYRVQHLIKALNAEEARTK
mmetsp:Transcript_19550/g.32668  ORF Transcript_19550/g.32668 Transcript_19550/m.32668 type:complete len:111 (-) Transcript_19550:1775-2107(-)